MLQVTGINGLVFEVEISDEACEKFGFKHGEKVLDPFKREAVVIGVAPLFAKSGCVSQGTDVLYIELSETPGKVCFFPNPEINLHKI